MLQFGGARPIPMSQRAFTRLRERIGDAPIQEHDLLGKMKSVLEAGDDVEVLVGPFENFRATFAQETAVGRAKIILSLFGRQTETEIEIVNLRRVEAC